jgi:predicted metal-dependent phosphoesterase TrpH
LRCQECDIRIQAITDHNEIWGAQQLKKILENEFDSVNLSIIIGEEVSTGEGEIIGLFLQEKIAAGLSPEETVFQIKAQGGLVLLPHGFDPLKRYRLQPEARERILADIDIVETFNARVSRPKWNRAAVDWAQTHQKLLSAGSDSHTFTDIGTAWVEVPRQKIETPHDLLAVLAEGGVPMGEWTHPVLAFLYKMGVQLRNKLKRRFA